MRVRPAVWLLGAVAALAACGDGGTDRAAVPEDVLAGHRYVTINVEGEGAATVPALDLTMAFDRTGGVVADTGCNTFSGRYTYDGFLLTVSKVTQTEIGCDSLVEEERWLRELLETPQPTGYADETGLGLEFGDVVIELMEETALGERADLVGTEWTAVAFFETDITRTVPTDTPGRLRLDPDGTYVAFDGCVEFTGTYVLHEEAPRGPAQRQRVGTIDLRAPPEADAGGCGEYQQLLRAVFGDGTSFILRGQQLNTFAAAGGGVFFSTES